MTASRSSASQSLSPMIRRPDGRLFLLTVDRLGEQRAACAAFSHRLRRRALEFGGGQD